MGTAHTADQVEAQAALERRDRGDVVTEAMLRAYAATLRQQSQRTCSDERPCINCYADHGECLGPSPETLRQRSTLRQQPRAVSDEAVQNACDMYDTRLPDDWDTPAACPSAMRTTIESLTPAQPSEQQAWAVGVAKEVKAILTEAERMGYMADTSIPLDTLRAVLAALARPASSEPVSGEAIDPCATPVADVGPLTLLTLPNGFQLPLAAKDGGYIIDPSYPVHPAEPVKVPDEIFAALKNVFRAGWSIDQFRIACHKDLDVLRDWMAVTAPGADGDVSNG